MLKVSMLAAATTLMFAASAYADVKTDCASDVKNYCAGIEPKGGKLRDCMAQNRAKLSNTCKLAIADRLLDRQAKSADPKSVGKGMAPKTDDE